jgi:hypothetical protein
LNRLRAGHVKCLRFLVEAALKAADRSRCGQVAPAAGLYLARVDY